MLSRHVDVSVSCVLFVALPCCSYFAEHLKKQAATKFDELLKHELRAQRICRIFIAQLENNNAEVWFVNLIEKNIFQRAIR